MMWFVVLIAVVAGVNPVAAVPQFPHEPTLLTQHEPMGRERNTTHVDISFCPNQCSDRGISCLKVVSSNAGSRITEYQCMCSSDFTGPACGSSLVWPSPEPRPPCPNRCSGRGICRALVCECEPGFEGDDCSSVSRDGACGDVFFCSGQGTCTYNDTSRTFGCVCAPGFGGDDCSRSLHLCGHCRHGKCVIRNKEAICECKPGFVGTKCDSYSPSIDPCHENLFCSGRGQCTVFSESQQICHCIPGFTSQTCAQLIRQEQSPFYGPCHLLSGCHGHGTCDDELAACVCDDTWTGQDCSVSRCSDFTNPNSTTNGICSRGGVCAAVRPGSLDYACLCDNGYSGPWCETRPCPKGCVHGTCNVDLIGENSTVILTTAYGAKVNQTTGTCVCENDAWKGEACDHSILEEPDVQCCPGDCSKHGVCKNCVCSCADGFSGANCETESVYQEEPVIF